MGVSLYTSRIVLATLGVSDFGIYNVVGSIVTMFVFLRSAMGNATNRYIAFSLGKGDFEKLKKVFSTCLIVHFILALIIIFLCETIGLWIFYYKMVIPPERMTAAFWTYQFSIITCAIGIICVPYDADIIAHEKMGAFAFMSVLDVSLKLLVVLLLTYFTGDKLIYYGLFLCIIQVIDRIIYGMYCHKKFEESRAGLAWDGMLVKEMFSFAGWNIIGNMAAIGCTPVLNILLNMFFGPVVNAARGIAIQVQSAVNGFVANFQLAIFPQITKTYASGDLDRMHKLIIYGSKFSYILFFCIALPLLLETESILSFWLVEVPDHTVSFLRIVLFIMIVESFERPLHTANLATGKLRIFQTVKGCTLLTMLPIAYIALKAGAPSEAVFVVQLVVTIISLIIQLFMIRPLINLPLLLYFKEVFLRSLLVTVVSFPLPLFLHSIIPSGGIVLLIVKCMITSIIVALCSFFIGLSKVEREQIIKKIKSIMDRRHNMALSD